MKRQFFNLGFAAVFLLLAGCASIPDSTLLNSQQAQNPAASPEEIAIGKTIYMANCAGCHGENLEGEANWKQQNEDGSFRSPPHSADGHTWHHADSILIEAITKGGARYEGLNIGGSSNMPAFDATLTDVEITAVLGYIKSTWPEDIRDLQSQQTIQNISQ